MNPPSHADLVALLREIPPARWPTALARGMAWAAHAVREDPNGAWAQAHALLEAHWHQMMDKIRALESNEAKLQHTLMEMPKLPPDGYWQELRALAKLPREV